MAVKKVNKTSEEVKVDASVDTKPEVEKEETKVEETATDSAVEVDTPEVEIPEVETTEDTKEDVKVDTSEVSTSKKPDGNVKIRMRVDHKCCIAMERYDLKAGQTYIVPTNVKNILNRAGLLAPL